VNPPCVEEGAEEKEEDFRGRAIRISVGDGKQNRGREKSRCAAIKEDLWGYGWEN